MVESLWASEVSAYSFTFDSGKVGELTIKYTMGWSAGFTFFSVGWLGIPGGS